MNEVKKILTQKINFFFRDFVGKAKSKTEVIVGFSRYSRINETARSIN
jgi:hypothetical protein